jgi:hypothetical protein
MINCAIKERYKSATEAWKAAKALSKKFKCNIVAYKCKIHKCYHVGNRY